MMLRVIFAAGFLAVLVFHLQSPAAYETPWCAVISEGYWDCQYRSIEECRPKCWRRVAAYGRSQPRAFCVHTLEEM
jgi:hypothetical protein